NILRYGFKQYVNRLNEYSKLNSDIKLMNRSCVKMDTIREDKHLEDIIIADLMISSEKVAHGQLNNPLEHALLVLIGSGYFAVPVLEDSNKLAGSISKTVILDQILGNDGYEVEPTSAPKVHEAMHDLVSVSDDASFIERLTAVIDGPCACAVDDEEYFKGTLTK